MVSSRQDGLLERAVSCEFVGFPGCACNRQRNSSRDAMATKKYDLLGNDFVKTGFE